MIVEMFDRALNSYGQQTEIHGLLEDIGLGTFLLLSVIILVYLFTSKGPDWN